MPLHTPDQDPRLIQHVPTLHDAWLSYEEQVLPADASAVQRKETRRAFYGGIQALMQLVIEPGLTEAKLESWRRELNYFVRLVERGQA